MARDSSHLGSGMYPMDLDPLHQNQSRSGLSEEASLPASHQWAGSRPCSGSPFLLLLLFSERLLSQTRSEERRVGKECA